MQVNFIKPAAIDADFQNKVQAWVFNCLGMQSAFSPFERNARFLEEACETVQANGLDRASAHRIVDYVFDRPVGELPQEIAGSIITLLALATSRNIDVATEAWQELRRIDTHEMILKIRDRQKNKPRHVRMDNEKDEYPIPPGECTSPNCDCDGVCRQRAAAMFRPRRTP